MKRLILLLPLILAAAPPAKAPTLTITRDERAMLLGFEGRAKAIQLQAQRDLDAVGREQDEYLTKVASRLGLPAETLKASYTVNLDTLAVEPRPTKGGK